MKKQAQPTAPGAGHLLEFLTAANTTEGQMKINELVNQPVASTTPPRPTHQANFVNILERCNDLGRQKMLEGPARMAKW